MSSLGGSIRNPGSQPQVTDVRRIEMQQPLMGEEDYDYETDTDIQIEEQAAAEKEVPKDTSEEKDKSNIQKNLLKEFDTDGDGQISVDEKPSEEQLKQFTKRRREKAQIDPVEYKYGGGAEGLTFNNLPEGLTYSIDENKYKTKNKTHPNDCIFDYIDTIQ